ncbi:hypothetical protein D049_0648A, partial [Vibrio parahaemolyticus VPTS-2010]
MLLLSLMFLIVASKLPTRTLIEREICQISAKITTKMNAVMACLMLAIFSS